MGGHDVVENGEDRLIIDVATCIICVSQNKSLFVVLFCVTTECALLEVRRVFN